LTIAFAQEDVLLVGIPECELDDYCRNVLLPLKQSLDETYMASATPISDLSLLLHTAMRRWDRANITHTLEPSKDIRTRGINSLEKGFEIGD